jgi:hypothetical protein
VGIYIAHRSMWIGVGTVAAQFFSGKICFKFSVLCLFGGPYFPADPVDILFKNDVIVIRPFVLSFSGIGMEVGGI